jgi:hypothetical protein
MTTEVRIEPCVYRDSPAILCRTPYHPAFVEQARRLGGRWSPASRAWIFDCRDRDRVEALCREVYGTAGEDDCDLVSVRIRARTDLYGAQEAVYFAGRVVAQARGRDSGARLGQGVVQIAGDQPRSGGSARYWHTIVFAGSEFELRDLPRPAVERAIAQERERGDGARWEIELLDDVPTIRDLSDRMGSHVSAAPSSAIEEVWNRILALPVEDRVEIRNRLLKEL